MPTGHRPGAEQVWPTRSARIRSGAHESGPEPSSARPGGAGHDYWNHNVAYHRWIIDAVARHGRCRVLDVGCGEGLLLQHLAPLVASATGVEKDEISVGRAGARLAGEANTLLVHCDFEQFVPDEDGYDLITFVASLHHMDPRAALTRAARMLRPGGELLVVGLTANRRPCGERGDGPEQGGDGREAAPDASAAAPGAAPGMRPAERSPPAIPRTRASHCGLPTPRPLARTSGRFSARSPAATATPPDARSRPSGPRWAADPGWR